MQIFKNRIQSLNYEVKIFIFLNINWFFFPKTWIIYFCQMGAPIVASKALAV